MADVTPEARVVSGLRRLNDVVALGVGAALLGACAFTLIDVIGRRLGAGLGGAEEVSGYVMAGATSWGMAFALLGLAHVRIDFARMRAGPRWRAALDILAMVALSWTAILIAMRCWTVLEKTIANNARANTALETPLWLPQLVWWSGWMWFAFCASALTLCAVAALARRDMAGADAMIGMGDEVADIGTGDSRP